MNTNDEKLAASLTSAARDELSKSVEKIEHCLSQLTDEQIWWRPDEGMNSIANLMLHLSGNLRQRIIVGIGGGDDLRNRPAEFADRSNRSKALLLDQLRQIAQEADRVLSKLSAEQLLQTHEVRGFDRNTIDAIFQCIPHFVGHTQEIIHLTREQLGKEYRFDYVPKSPEQISEFGPAI